MAVVDGDPWVAMVAEILKTYPATGALNMEIGSATDEYTRKIFNDLANDLRKLGISFYFHHFDSRFKQILTVFIVNSEKAWGNRNASTGMSLFEQDSFVHRCRSTGEILIFAPKKTCFVIFFHVCLESSCKAFHAEEKTKVSGAASRVIAKIHRCSE